jgi:signal transduction histidine kinase
MRSGLQSSPQAVSRHVVQGNRWLIKLRWLAAGGIIAGGVVAQALLGYPVPALALTALGLAVAGYNAVLAHVDRRLSRRPAGPARDDQALANVQIGLDLMALAVLIHLSGGIENPFATFFLFHMIIAGILLPPVAAYAQALFASACYATVLLGEQFGLWRHFHIFGAESHRLTDLDVAAQLAVMASALLIAAYLTTTITERLRQRERELAGALDEVQASAQACELARDDLQRTQEMRLRYMRRVSHELRAPLTSIGMSLRVIADGVGKVPPEKQTDLLRRAEARTETLLDMVDDLLVLSRMREAPLQEPMSPVSLPRLIEDVVDTLSDMAAARNQHLLTDIEPALPSIPGQPEGLATMLRNLVGNAIKYTPPGGQITIRAAMHAAPRQVVLQVQDTGQGIAAEEVPRLFDEFFRSESVRQANVHGTGLGLSIVKRVVDTHGGTIEVESELNKGTTFTVRLPVGDEGAAESSESA